MTTDISILRFFNSIACIHFFDIVISYAQFMTWNHCYDLYGFVNLVEDVCG